MKWVYDPDPEKVKAFQKSFPTAKAAASEEEVLSDPEVKLVCGAAVTSERCALGLRVMAAGKDYFTDKAPLTTLEQLEAAREMVRNGQEIHGLLQRAYPCGGGRFRGRADRKGSHRKAPSMWTVSGRTGWEIRRAARTGSLKREKYGGILCDIGSHQIEQFLYYCGATGRAGEVQPGGKLRPSRLSGAGGFRGRGPCGGQRDRPSISAWTGLRRTGFPPGRRKNLHSGNGRLHRAAQVRQCGDRNGTGDHVFLVNQDGEQHFEVAGKVGYPFFGQLILDCINRTENAMTQKHAFKAAELCVRAELQAVNLTAEK